MNQKHELPVEKRENSFNQKKCLDFLASRYVELTPVLYLVSIAAVVVLALLVFIEGSAADIGGVSTTFRFFLIATLGYFFVTYVFGLNAILIEIHQNLKKIANK